MSVAFVGGREARLRQVLPVEGAAARLAALPLFPASLEGEQPDVTHEGNAPGGQTP